MADLTTFDVELARSQPAEVARLLEHVEVKAAAEYLQTLPEAAAARVGAHLSALRWAQLMLSTNFNVASLLQHAELTDALGVLSRLNVQARSAAVEQMEVTERQQQLARFLTFPPHCVGAIVKHPTCVVRNTMHKNELVEELRRHGRLRDCAVVVIDSATRYVGVLDPWQVLVNCPEDGEISGCVDRVPGLRPERAQEDAASLAIWNTHTWLPVVDHEAHLLGICRRSELAAKASQAEREDSRLTDSVYEGLGELTDIVLGRSGK